MTECLPRMVTAQVIPSMAKKRLWTKGIKSSFKPSIGWKIDSFVNEQFAVVVV